MKNLLKAIVVVVGMTGFVGSAFATDVAMPEVKAGKQVWLCRGEGNQAQSFIPQAAKDGMTVVHIKKVDSQKLKGELKDFGVYMSYFYRDTNDPQEWLPRYPDKDKYLQVSRVLDEKTIEAKLVYDGSNVGEYHARVWIENKVTGEFLWIDLDDPFCRNAKDENRSPGYEFGVDSSANFYPAGNYQERL